VITDHNYVSGHVRCPALPTVDHATLFYVKGEVTDEVPNTGIACTGVTDGNSCHFACQTGYRLTGPPALICNYSGTWLGDIPSCQSGYFGLILRILYHCIRRIRKKTVYLSVCFHSAFHLPGYMNSNYYLLTLATKNSQSLLENIAG